MKHKHYDLIVAKAANMNLVVFRLSDNDGWVELSQSAMPKHKSYDYFLCLPQHKEACLHWLNGGEVQAMDSNWVNMFPIENYPWEGEHDFMDDEVNIRIKPKKEKRWIAFGSESGNVYGAYLSEEKCKMAWPNLQIFEIEVEV